jgi:RNA 2',3'-cyclic 3'-phosphodiesterase
MPRLFVALRPPEPVLDQLLGLMEGLTGLRWQAEDQLHLTLRYIGEVDNRAADEVALALESVRFPGFSLALNGVGAFDKGGKMNALWAGVSPVKAVTLLHKKLDRALVSLGFPPEGRAFVPHITLARTNRAPPGLGDWMAAHGGLASAPFVVADFGLYESHLSRSGAVYEEIAAYRLTG